MNPRKCKKFKNQKKKLEQTNNNKFLFVNRFQRRQDLAIGFVCNGGAFIIFRFCCILREVSTFPFQLFIHSGRLHIIYYFTTNNYVAESFHLFLRIIMLYIHVHYVIYTCERR